MGKVQKICLLWIMFFLATVALTSRGIVPNDYSPQPFFGKFEYNGNISPVVKVQIEKVFGSTTAGKERIKQLKNLGYECRHIMAGTWRCIHQSQLSEVAQWLRQRTEDILTPDSFEFLPNKGPIEEVVNNDSYKLWRVHRPVETKEGVYHSYQWSWTPVISKILLKHDKEMLPNVYINLDDNLQLSMQYSANKTIDKNRFETHIVRVHFSRIEE